MCSSKREEENVTIYIYQQELNCGEAVTYEAILKLAERRR